MKLFLEDIKQDILNKAVSKFTFEGKRWEIYQTMYRGANAPCYNLVDVESTKMNKLKRFDTLSEALESINFRDSE